MPILSWSCTDHVLSVVFGARATTAQLCPHRDTLEFEQVHVTKNQPITLLILLSETLGI